MANTETLGMQADEYTDKLGERTKKTLEEAKKSIQTKSQDAWEDIVEFMRKNPGKSLGIAVAAGAAFGMAVAGLGRGNSSSAKSHIKGLASSGADAWDRVKSGFDAALCNLKDAFEEAGQKFK